MVPAAPAADQVEIGVFDAFDGRNVGIQFYKVPIKAGQIFAKDIIDAYCNRWRGKISQDIQIKCNFESKNIRYDQASDDLVRFNSCDFHTIDKYNLFVTKRFRNIYHKKNVQREDGPSEYCREEYESEV